MKNYNVIGKRIPRHDGIQQVTGKTIYTEDIYRAGMLHAKALFSKYAHAEVLNIDISEAENIPGVVAIITSKDVPHNRHGYSHKDQPILVDKKVRHKGDALAVVAAESIEIAERAIGHIKVEYKVLPTVFDPRQAMEDNAPIIHENSNIITHIEMSNGDIEEGFSKSDFILEEDFSTQKIQHSPIETHVTLAELENDGKLVIWTANSRPFVYVTHLAKVLNLPLNKFQIKTPAVGGGFGGKNQLNLEPWVSLLTLKTGRPVKMIFTREEEFTSTTVRHPYQMKYKTGYKKDGTILARQVELISDGGAYVSLGEATLTKAAAHCIGPYNIPNVKIDSYLVYTNNVVGGAMRGFGVPQVCFAYESHTDSIAHKLGISPLEFRQKNMFKITGNMPTRQTVNSKPLNKTMQEALRLAGDTSQRSENNEEKR